MMVYNKDIIRIGLINFIFRSKMNNDLEVPEDQVKAIWFR